MIHELILADGIDDFSKCSNTRKAAKANALGWNLGYRAIIAPADEKSALEAISDIQHMEIDAWIIVA